MPVNELVRDKDGLGEKDGVPVEDGDVERVRESVEDPDAQAEYEGDGVLEICALSENETVRDVDPVREAEMQPEEVGDDEEDREADEQPVFEGLPDTDTVDEEVAEFVAVAVELTVLVTVLVEVDVPVALDVEEGVEDAV